MPTACLNVTVSSSRFCTPGWSSFSAAWAADAHPTQSHQRSFSISCWSVTHPTYPQESNLARIACWCNNWALLRPNPHPRSAALLSLADSDPLRHLQCAPGDPSKVQEAETTQWCALGVRTVASGVPLGASDVAEPVASIFACLCPSCPSQLFPF